MSERNKGPADDLFNQEQGGTREDNLQPVGRMTIHYRAMGLDDVGQVPLDCHGSAEALAQRISDLGSAAILAFDGDGVVPDSAPIPIHSRRVELQRRIAKVRHQVQAECV